MVSPRRARLSRWAEMIGIELIFFDPPSLFDDAIVGIVHGFKQEPVILYDQAKVIAALIDSGMTEDEAEEYFEFNTIGAWVGEATPRFLLVEPDDA